MTHVFALFTLTHFTIFSKNLEANMLRIKSVLLLVFLFGYSGNQLGQTLQRLPNGKIGDTKRGSNSGAACYGTKITLIFH